MEAVKTVPVAPTTPAPFSGPPRTAIDLFRRRLAASGPRVALRYKEAGTWRTVTWTEWDRAAREIASGLRSLGVKPGERVCLLANTRWEWFACDVGILMAGAVTVPIYQSNTPEQCEYIINDCGARVVIVEDRQQVDKLVSEWHKLTNVMKVVIMTSGGNHEWSLSLADLRARGVTWLGENASVLEGSWEEVQPESMFTIVYTSGTTGPPKGVVLPHKCIAFECNTMQDLLSIGEDDEQLLFLPLAHIFARLLEWTSISIGCRTAFAEGIPQLIENMKEVQPTFMGAVPRVYEKAYAKIQASFSEKRKKAITRVLIDWALATGRQVSALRQRGQEPAGILGIKAALADKLVFGKIKATFGGRLRYFISGGAPLSREIAEFFHAAGILILEGYGLTETTAATNVNRPSRFRFGTVGPAIPGVEVRIAQDGEILIRGDNVLREYYRKQEATREAIDSEGYFHTGDIGVIEDGFLRITDRKKDIIVTAGGKNVAPQNVENTLKAACPLISQVMVWGDKRPFLVALVTVGEEPAQAWATERGISADMAALAQHPELRAAIQTAVDRVNSKLPSYETVKRIEILGRDFAQETGELTPTLKVKRKFCYEKYKDLVDGMYESPSAKT